MSALNTIPNPFNITIGGVSTPFDVVLYQASGGQLFWLNEDSSSVFLGSPEHLSLTSLPAATTTAVRSTPKLKD